MVCRWGDKLIQRFLLWIAIFHAVVQVVNGQDPCTLCADGSDPDMNLSSEELGWNCWDLNSFASILQNGDAECTELQIVGFQDCACPTFPAGFCTLCPGGFSDIPDKSVTVPSTNNLTCGDILFVETALLQNGCDDLAPYRERCGCPAEAECTYCADGTMPMYADRKIPYLSTPGSEVTCSGQASLAFSATADQCDGFTVAPVAVNGQGYCGCQGTFPSNLCSLCPAGTDVENPDVVLPGSGGMTCLEMEEYVRYITDEAACHAIADSAQQVCCEPMESCPVCGDMATYNKEKPYDPYGLNCENIGMAPHFGFPMTCDDVQARFPYYCECPEAVPACTLCQLGELPPETSKEIPLFGTTCQEVNDYTSLRLATECGTEKSSFPFDASAYCGCTGFEAPKACTFCPDGEIVRNANLVPGGAGGASCGELMDFADYVRTPDLCSSVQAFSSDCCMDPTAPTIAPTVTPPTLESQPPGTTSPDETIAPTVAPTNATNAPGPGPEPGPAPAPDPATPPPTSSATTKNILVPILTLIAVSCIG
jgi:hypothetical protein